MSIFKTKIHCYLESFHTKIDESRGKTDKRSLFIDKHIN